MIQHICNLFSKFSCRFLNPNNFFQLQQISKFLQILGLQPRVTKVFLDHQNNFFSQQVRTILVAKYHSQKQTLMLKVQNIYNATLTMFISRLHLKIVKSINYFEFRLQNRNSELFSYTKRLEEFFEFLTRKDWKSFLNKSLENPILDK